MAQSLRDRLGCMGQSIGQIVKERNQWTESKEQVVGDRF